MLLFSFFFVIPQRSGGICFFSVAPGMSEGTKQAR
jgi:hypothetical protein